MDWTYDLSQTPAAAALAVACAMTAAVSDHRHGFIANRLTYPFIVAGLSLAAATGGFVGLLASAAGLLAASGLFLVAFMAGSCGGGDVKLMAALGAILGLFAAMDVTLAALMCGGAIAVVAIARRAGASGVARSLSLFAVLLPAGLRHAGLSLKPRGNHTVRFGVAVAAGLVWCLMLPDLTPLSFVR